MRLPPIGVLLVQHFDEFSQVKPHDFRVSVYLSQAGIHVPIRVKGHNHWYSGRYLLGGYWIGLIVILPFPSTEVCFHKPAFYCVQAYLAALHNFQKLQGPLLPQYQVSHRVLRPSDVGDLTIFHPQILHHDLSNLWELELNTQVLFRLHFNLVSIENMDILSLHIRYNFLYLILSLLNSILFCQKLTEILWLALGLAYIRWYQCREDSEFSCYISLAVMVDYDFVNDAAYFIHCKPFASSTASKHWWSILFDSFVEVRM